MDEIQARYELLRSVMNERVCRLWAAAEALALGHGGNLRVAKATGISGRRIWEGKRELRALAEQLPEEPAREQRIRRPGGGRKHLTETDPTLLQALEALVGPTTRGDPGIPLRWTCKSVRTLAEELTQAGHPVSGQTVSELLHQLGYSLQGNRKTTEGKSHPDRNQQFEHIAAQTRAFQARGLPVVSVDTKKKELVGDFKNGGREWRPEGQPQLVRSHDFMDKTLGKAIPYGVYDVSRNEGWVSVGLDHDTAEFAAASIYQWWKRMGQHVYPEAAEVLIMADSGGSNASHSRLWKVAMQMLADRTGLKISVCHFPPGTSKWNKIEHRMFCHITQNWRGQPLVSHEVIVNLIGHTETREGLHIRAALDPKAYPVGRKVTNKELAEVHLARAVFHGDWNYTIAPGTDFNNTG